MVNSDNVKIKYSLRLMT